MSPETAHRITLVSVTGLADAQGAARALAFSQRQLPACRALLCSPVRPADLPPGIEHLPIAPLNYHEYSWFMLFALWRVVPTEFALVVQEDGWVLEGASWRDDYLAYDYVGAPIHLARIDTPEGVRWSRRFAWSTPEHPLGQGATPVQNGGFSLRSQRLMRALVDHPHIRVEVPAPDVVGGDPLRMQWQHDALLEDVQLSGVLRPALEAVGLRFAPVEVARSFAIEHAGLLHHGYDALQLFGHHSKLRRLAAIDPPTLRYRLPRSHLARIYGEPELLQLFERRGYAVEFEPEPVPAAPRRVFDTFTYNGEREVLLTRLNELSAVVDCFVVVEATRTFAGEPKALRFDPADPALEPFIGRIRYVVVDDMPDDPPGAESAAVEGDWLNDPPRTGFWLREKFQRNQILRGLADAAPHDLVLISDADEIPRAERVLQLRDAPHDQVFGLRLRLYYFYANYRNVAGPESDTVWTVACPRAWLDVRTPDQMRLGVRFGAVAATLVADAGWHLSYLGMQVDAVRQKIRGFAHQEYRELADAIDLTRLVTDGLDLYRRAGYQWALVDAAQAPAWLRAEPSMQHLFATPHAEVLPRYAKESYVAVAPSSFGKWEHHPNRHILQAYAGHVQGRVIDLGCNHGASTWWLTQNPRVREVVGVDVNAAALAVAQRLFADVMLPHAFVHLDLTQGQAIDPPGDTLVSFHTLEHIYPADVAAFLAAAYRSLRPGGCFVVSIPYDRAYPDPCHVGFYTEASLSACMCAAGFEVVECFKDDRFAEKGLLTGLFQRPLAQSL